MLSTLAAVFVVLGCVLGMVLGFFGLATLCDAWLVPWLVCTQKKCGISDDLAGVTLLAFGGAAPEIVISIVAVMQGDTDVGFGLVAGSALIAFGFIPPFCYFSTGKPLKLSPGPIVRDTGVYICSLGAVGAMMFTDDGDIKIWESALLLVILFVYIVFVVATSTQQPVVRRQTLAVRKSLLPGRAGSMLGGSESAELLPPDDAEKGDDEGAGLFGRAYLHFDAFFHVMLEYTVPTPPDDDRPEEEPPSGLWTALGLFGSFVWLAGLSEAVYYLVLTICDSTSFLSPVALGAVLLAAGAQIPDSLAAASMAKMGQPQGAISSTLASQIIALTLGFGLPWTIYIGMGNSVVLASTPGTEIVDGTLLGIVVVVALAFTATTLLTLSPPKEGKVVVDRAGSVVVASCFGAGLVGFIVIEGLYQAGVL